MNDKNDTPAKAIGCVAVLVVLAAVPCLVAVVVKWCVACWRVVDPLG